MKIEIVTRFKKTKTPQEIKEEKEHLETMKIIHGDDYEAPPLSGKSEYDYEPICIDTEEIRIFNPIDETHMCIRTYQGDTWICEASYNSFKEFYEKITKKPIYKYESI